MNMSHVTHMNMSHVTHEHESRHTYEHESRHTYEHESRHTYEHESRHTYEHESRHTCEHGVSTISRLLKIIGLFCRISSLLYGSFAKETCNFKEPTNRSHPICRVTRCNGLVCTNGESCHTCSYA